MDTTWTPAPLPSPLATLPEEDLPPVLPAPIRDAWSGHPDTDRYWR